MFDESETVKSESVLRVLNQPQREAVSAENGTMLVLAGAGSGKTRVLTHRIAWLLQNNLASSHEILAVTFTNKASKEMRERVMQLLDLPSSAMWIGTFHGLSHRILRRHCREAKLSPQFEIIDGQDQIRILRKLIRDENLDEEEWPAKKIQWVINHYKEEGIRPEQIADQFGKDAKVHRSIYDIYQRHCQAQSLVDFPELLLRCLELFKENREILAHYQQRFQHILVDEFQDTNAIQYEWLRLLATHSQNFMVVGDDDQSIYSWRGSKIENLLRFESQFPDSKVIRLEQNYRSTSVVLRAANAVISKNQGRLGKKLWTEGLEGEPILLYNAYDEVDEARFAVDQIRQWVEQGNQRSDAAILYRSNAQSRTFEEALVNSAIPYQVYGGLKFFERAEIKDALAYLKLLLNPDSDHAFSRIVNLPPRGIGARTLENLHHFSQQESTSLWEASIKLVKAKELGARASEALAGFIRLMEGLRTDLEATGATQSLASQVELILEGSHLLDHYRQIKGEIAASKVENLLELVTAARNFQHSDSDESSPIQQFLANAALESGETQGSDWEDCAQLMTLHAAKGLEFNLVIIPGLEENLFPHSRSSHDPQQIEEERRLCYVGMTRARRRLILSHTQTRKLYGREHYNRPSRFLYDLPEDCIQGTGLQTEITNSAQPQKTTFRPHRVTTEKSYNPPQSAPLQPGCRVRHQKFGIGTVVNIKSHGEDFSVQVQFANRDSKWLIYSLAGLRLV